MELCFLYRNFIEIKVMVFYTNASVHPREGKEGFSLKIVCTEDKKSNERGTAQSLKHAQLDLGLQEQELQGGGSNFTFRTERSRCQWPLALCGYQDPLTPGGTSA